MSLSDDAVKVFCGNVEGMLDPSRFGPGCKSRCIEHRGRWLTPPEFEQLAGKSRHYRWRKNIKSESGTRFGELMTNGFLTACEKNCRCGVCDGDVDVSASQFKSVAKTTSRQNDDMLNVKVKSDSTLNVSRDTDSDSGISIVSSTNNHIQNSLLKTVSPLANVLPSPSVSESKESFFHPSASDCKDSIDYPSMVQEAIASLTSGQTDCTNLNILLYILNRHSPSEDISTIHTKVRTALSFLTRMGFVKKTGDDDGDISDDANADDNNVVQEKSPQKKKKTLPTKSEESNKKPKKLSSNVVVKMKPKNLTVKKADELKAKAKGVVNKTSKENVDVAAKKVVVFKPKKLSPELAAICGRKKLSRQETLKRIWRYVKLRKLQDPAIKTKINCDEKLKAVTKKKKIDQTEMLALLKLHMTDI